MESKTWRSIVLLIISCVMLFTIRKRNPTGSIKNVYHMKVRFKDQYLDMNSSFYTRTVSLNFTYRFGGYKKQNVKGVDTSRFGH